MHLPSGKIHKLLPGETLPELAKRVGAKLEDLTPMDKMPEEKCDKCHGTGRVKRGLNSKRFKLCECTLDKMRAGKQLHDVAER